MLAPPKAQEAIPRAWRHRGMFEPFPEYDPLLTKLVMIGRMVGIPFINGERYIDMFDRSCDGTHVARGSCNIKLSAMMFEDIIAALYAIVPAASAPSITMPFVVH